MPTLWKVNKTARCNISVGLSATTSMYS